MSASSQLNKSSKILLLDRHHRPPSLYFPAVGTGGSLARVVAISCEAIHMRKIQEVRDAPLTAPVPVIPSSSCRTQANKTHGAVTCSSSLLAFSCRDLPRPSSCAACKTRPHCEPSCTCPVAQRAVRVREEGPP
jgi:hypothetical protein